MRIRVKGLHCERNRARVSHAREVPIHHVLFRDTFAEVDLESRLPQSLCKPLWCSSQLLQLLRPLWLLKGFRNSWCQHTRFRPPKKDDNKHYRHARVKLSKVKLDEPKFRGSGSNAEEFKMLPRHTRIQRMAYNSKTEVGIEARDPKKVRSDKFKIGKEKLLDREILKEDDREIIIKRMLAMVKTGRRMPESKNLVMKFTSSLKGIPRKEGSPLTTTCLLLTYHTYQGIRPLKGDGCCLESPSKSVLRYMFSGINGPKREEYVS
ncbi:DNA-directed RNA polymerases IV and V subunit 2, partial [Mucuna pruriens]